MHKKNSANSNYEHCCICFPTDDEAIFIIDSLLHKIYKALNALKKEDTQTQTSKLEPLDFCRLLKMIFCKRYKNLKSTSSCKHLQIKKQFLSKLNCSQKQLDRVSSNMSWKLAKFQFHADVIISQSKQFIRHFTQKQDSKQSDRQQSQKKESYNDIQEKEELPQRHLPYMFQSQVNMPSQNQNPESFYNPYTCLWQIPWPTHILMQNPQIQQERTKIKNSSSSQIAGSIAKKIGRKFQSRYKE